MILHPCAPQQALATSPYENRSVLAESAANSQLHGSYDLLVLKQRNYRGPMRMG